MTDPEAREIAPVAELGDALGTAVGPANATSAVIGILGFLGAAACSFAQVEPDGGRRTSPRP